MGRRAKCNIRCFNCHTYHPYPPNQVIKEDEWLCGTCAPLFMRNKHLLIHMMYYQE